ncbi:hypothetical protein BLNAU_4456 [Blattamonas nauphoetae]|uniref:Uncharacterized protein n=1 Tax=Blattamonas nauphoetae TaxID=2049346 RepID=A0ABQ9Y9W8_9EUKA|nr:hypothetical protein BLNAU_4456 [Blattamonas nauphoetae]
MTNLPTIIEIEKSLPQFYNTAKDSIHSACNTADGEYELAIAHQLLTRPFPIRGRMGPPNLDMCNYDDPSPGNVQLRRTYFRDDGTFNSIPLLSLITRMDNVPFSLPTIPKNTQSISDEDLFDNETDTDKQTIDPQIVKNLPISYHPLVQLVQLQWMNRWNRQIQVMYSLPLRSRPQPRHIPVFSFSKRLAQESGHPYRIRTAFEKGAPKTSCALPQKTPPHTFVFQRNQKKVVGVPLKKNKPPLPIQPNTQNLAGNPELVDALREYTVGFIVEGDAEDDGTIMVVDEAQEQSEFHILTPQLLEEDLPVDKDSIVLNKDIITVEQANVAIDNDTEEEPQRSDESTGILPPLSTDHSQAFLRSLQRLPPSTFPLPSVFPIHLSTSFQSNTPFHTQVSSFSPFIQPEQTQPDNTRHFETPSYLNWYGNAPSKYLSLMNTRIARRQAQAVDDTATQAQPETSLDEQSEMQKDEIT